MPEPYYPPAAFYFSVAVLGSPTSAPPQSAADAAFQEVSGIRVEFSAEELVEGGENRFSHRLPQRSKYPNLVLKRGLVAKNSFLADWVNSTLGSALSTPIVTQNLQVSLLNESGEPLAAWRFTNVYPIRWETAPLSSQESKVLIETLEFSYNFFERVNTNG
jgi:phage tail-like protein